MKATNLYSAMRWPACVLVIMLVGVPAVAQAPVCSNPGGDCSGPIRLDAPPNYNACHNKTNFSATPFLDGCTNGAPPCQVYDDPDNNVVSMYGVYGNLENSSQFVSTAQAHYTLGKNLATNNIVPLCKNGLPPNGTCAEGGVGKIVFLFLGFSNCDIEACGGDSDAWDKQDIASPQAVNGHLPGQPCATQCQNVGSPTQSFPWNQVRGTTATKDVGDDGITQQSFLYQIYSPSTPLVGTHVVVFNGAYGSLLLGSWDPYDGYYNTNNFCPFEGTGSTDTECNYARAKSLLTTNGFTEAQVQAILFKTTSAYPNCDLKRGTGNCLQNDLADAEAAEEHLSNIVQYLRCCELTSNGYPASTSRYPNLRQVFLMSRTYAGYANNAYATYGTTEACLNPEPFAYELSFGIQRLIVGQIDQDANITDADPYITNQNPTSSFKPLQYNPTPNVAGGSIWFDWAPYLWANGTIQSPGNQLFWCDSATQNVQNCINDQNNPGDFRYGDLTNASVCYGDHTHPSYRGAAKVAGRLVKWIRPDLNGGLGLGTAQGFISDWVTPWIGK